MWDKIKIKGYKLTKRDNIFRPYVISTSHHIEGYKRHNVQIVEPTDCATIVDFPYILQKSLFFILFDNK